MPQVDDELVRAAARAVRHCILYVRRKFLLLLLCNAPFFENGSQIFVYRRKTLATSEQESQLQAPALGEFVFRAPLLFRLCSFRNVFSILADKKEATSRDGSWNPNPKR